MFIAILLGKKPDIANETAIAIMVFIGLILVGIGVLGRVWASMYIYGYKTAKLINEGPYSVVRNPLYCFSFIGAVGMALASANFIFIFMLLIAYLTYYPFVVISEENGLKEALGEEYIEYTKKVPRFIPKFSLFTIPEVYTVKAKFYVRAFVDSIWFFIIYGFVVLITILHLKEMLPTMF